MSLTSHPGVDNHTGIVTLKNKKIIAFHIEEERKAREKRENLFSRKNQITLEIFRMAIVG